eukprot:gene6335-7061_t
MPKYLEQQILNKDGFITTLIWVSELCETFDLAVNVTFLTIQLFQDILRAIPNIPKLNIQGVAVTALFMADKFHSANPQSASTYAYMTAGAVDHHTILDNVRITTRRRTATSNEASGSGDAQINFGASRSILVHPDRFYGYPNEDVVDWFASFERIARANEWDTAKCGRMVSAYLRGPAGDHFEKVPEEEKADYEAVKRSLIKRFSPADMRRSAYSTLAARKQGR